MAKDAEAPEIVPGEEILDPLVFAKRAAGLDQDAQPTAQTPKKPSSALPSWRRPLEKKTEDESGPVETYTFVAIEAPNQDMVFGGGERIQVGGQIVVRPILHAEFVNSHFSTTDRELAKQMVLKHEWYGVKYTAHNTKHMKKFVTQVRKEAGFE